MPTFFLCPPPQLTTLRGSILEDAVPSTSKHGIARGLPLKEVLEYLVPELNTHCLRLALNTPKVTEQLMKLDEQGVGAPLQGWGAGGLPSVADVAGLCDRCRCKSRADLRLPTPPLLIR